MQAFGVAAIQEIVALPLDSQATAPPGSSGMPIIGKRPSMTADLMGNPSVWKFIRREVLA